MFCRDDLVANCDVYYKHSLVVLQEVVKGGITAHRARPEKAVNRSHLLPGSRSFAAI